MQPQRDGQAKIPVQPQAGKPLREVGQIAPVSVLAPHVYCLRSRDLEAQRVHEVGKLTSILPDNTLNPTSAGQGSFLSTEEVARLAAEVQAMGMYYQDLIHCRRSNFLSEVGFLFFLYQYLPALGPADWEEFWDRNSAYDLARALAPLDKYLE